MDTTVFGFGLPEDHIHAPDERLVVGTALHVFAQLSLYGVCNTFWP